MPSPSSVLVRARGSGMVGRGVGALTKSPWVGETSSTPQWPWHGCCHPPSHNGNDQIFQAQFLPSELLDHVPSILQNDQWYSSAVPSALTLGFAGLDHQRDGHGGELIDPVQINHPAITRIGNSQRLQVVALVHDAEDVMVHTG